MDFAGNPSESKIFCTGIRYARQRVASAQKLTPISSWFSKKGTIYKFRFWDFFPLERCGWVNPPIIEPQKAEGCGFGGAPQQWEPNSEIKPGGESTGQSAVQHNPKPNPHKYNYPL